MENYFRDRYAGEEQESEDDDEDYESDEEHFSSNRPFPRVVHRRDEPAPIFVPSNDELPTNSDPNLWIIKVKQGEERQTALKLLRKCIAQKNAGNVNS